MMKQQIINSIDTASKVIGKTWPLYTFVASNPLSGYENSTFLEAVNSAEENFGANAFPSAKLYKQAWQKGDINKDVLTSLLKESNLTESPEFYLNLLTSANKKEIINENHSLDIVMAKWLSSFMDEGLAEWEMPYKSEGFYTAWRLLVVYDAETTGRTSLKEIPKTSLETLEQILKGYSESDCVKIFTHHLAALPGWTGYINHRTQSNSDWHQQYPIDAIDYLAVRLWSAQKLKSSLLPKEASENKNTLVKKVQYIFLKAWEQSWQNQLVKTLEHESIKTPSVEKNIPDAQLVFCIDTRSELIRRHVESKGNYETFGYAGFFGIAMDYKSLDDGITRKSCPPIVGSAYVVSEAPQINKDVQFDAYNKKNDVASFKKYILRRMKNMIPSAFGYVEGSGLFYGISLIGRTLLPRKMYQMEDKKASKIEGICQPDMNKAIIENNDNTITLDQKVGIVKSAFDLMGWKQFAPLVVFAGHGSHSANNPFSSSLDCGACAASPGRHNARMLAKLANLPEVRKSLAENHQIHIPQNTLFLGAEHNTTTDDIILFDAEAPDYHKQLIKDLKLGLLKAQKTATEDRLGNKGNSVSSAEKKANNWGETRPEWGLAKNAGFIVGPRELTKHTNLDSRCFLHSYEWELDTEGKALEGIMQGPMTVTQWINNHYYFSTVDNNLYGGGTKITHNITGKFGVVQGNGGDLKMGLPLQSLFGSDENMYHQPLRLSVVIKAPIARVSEIIARNAGTKTLLDNEWIYLMVMDPTSKNEVFKYKKAIQWELVSTKN
ncbi:DUF2309 domain-containing protein [Polaribacter sp. Hel_I_88]|uniref:DUF2309 domain-containing protein n=1 Tax=Polaribacter sp. Hel_I_88 TaxID=1250006 RepID=UPI00047CD82D|nr:DUF2309 domain-containing protein [Polaribacter sp. Hel_I_88]